MPNYDYRCKKCGDVFEVYQPITDDPLTSHPDCGGPVHRIFAPVGIVFKGSGFHKTDSRSSSSARSSTASSGSSKSDGGDSSGSGSGSKADGGSSSQTSTPKDAPAAKSTDTTSTSSTS